MNRIIIILTLAALVVLLSCKAPHDNPLDPDSDFFRAPVDSTINLTLTPAIHSVHISRIFPTTDSYSVLASMFIEGDVVIDSVFVQYRSNTRVFLLPLTTEGEWATLFSSTYFGDQTLGSVIGQPFVFTAEDEANRTFTTLPNYLFRVIESTPQIVSPRNGAAVNTNPTLEWSAFSVNFPFGYKPTVILLLPEGGEATAWTAGLLGSTITSIEVSDTLAEGDYYWTLMVIDSFENSSRSKEGYFTVIHP